MWRCTEGDYFSLQTALGSMHGPWDRALHLQSNNSTNLKMMFSFSGFDRDRDYDCDSNACNLLNASIVYLLDYWSDYRLPFFDCDCDCDYDYDYDCDCDYDYEKEWHLPLHLVVVLVPLLGSSSV